MNRGKSAHIALITYVCNSNLFILDEPTIGLHPKDAEILLKNLRQLQRKGANIVVIEHDIDVIQQSDYIIEMGDKGGLEGGQIIASGTSFYIYYYCMIALALVFRGIIPTIENLFWDRSYTLIGEIKV